MTANAPLVEYDFARAATLQVPGDWNSQRPDLFFYEGTVWYEKDFTWHPRKGSRVFLHVGAANTFSRAWVNGVACPKLCQNPNDKTGSRRPLSPQ